MEVDIGDQMYELWCTGKALSWHVLTIIVFMLPLISTQCYSHHPVLSSVPSRAEIRVRRQLLCLRRDVDVSPRMTEDRSATCTRSEKTMEFVLGVLEPSDPR